MTNTILAFFFCLIIFQANMAFGLSCETPGSPQERLAKSVVVFSGTVKEVGKVKSKKVEPTETTVNGVKVVHPMGEGFDPEIVQVTFNVEEAWKGVDLEVISIGVFASSLEQYKVGSKFLIYGQSLGEEGVVGVFFCNGPLKYENAQMDLKQLGSGKKFVKNLRARFRYEFCGSLMYFTSGRGAKDYSGYHFLHGATTYDVVIEDQSIKTELKDNYSPRSLVCIYTNIIPTKFIKVEAFKVME